MVISLILDEDAVAVAAVRTCTVVALPNTLRGIVVPVHRVHVVPPSRLYSRAVETPVIASLDPLYTAFGADARAATVMFSVADAEAPPAAFTRI